MTAPSAAAVTPLDDLTIRSLSVGSMDNDSYLLTCRVSGEQLLVDAADDAPRLLALVAEGAGRRGEEVAGALDTVVTTHRHPDHHRALADVVRVTGARTAAGVEDADALPVAVDVRLSHGDVVHCGGVALDVVHLRGHTPGSVALVHRDSGGSTHAFTGDSLFPGGPGRTTSPADFRSLMDDLEERVFALLPDDAVVHPGHGAPTTIGAERPRLGEWRARGW